MQAFMEVVGQIDDTKRCGLRGAFVDRKWRQEWFQPCVDNLRACKFKRLTDNFVTLGANPGNVDWFDDAGWANIVEHWRIASQPAVEIMITRTLRSPSRLAS